MGKNAHPDSNEKEVGRFEYDRFPINKDSRDNGCGGPSVWRRMGGVAYL